jgi:threonine aldolase
MFCLSKGLSCPVGSLIVGDKEFITRARKNRKMVGGGMRQAGVIAAPGIVALNSMVDRLKEDHSNAKRLAQGLKDECGLDLDVSAFQTNIVVADVSPMLADDYVAEATKKGVLTLAFGKNSVRFVTHYGISSADIDAAIERLGPSK